MIHRFALAPMDLTLRLVSATVLPLPFVFLMASFRLPRPVNGVFLGVFFFLLFIYAVIWLWFRPTRFEFDDTAFKIIWPIRSKSWKRAELTGAQLISAAEFRKRYGLGIRIGSGGLWGAFGLLKTSQQTFTMYVSRTDSFVLLNFQTGRPLLITPERPVEFVNSLNLLAGSS